MLEMVGERPNFMKPALLRKQIEGLGEMRTILSSDRANAAARGIQCIEPIGRDVMALVSEACV